MAARVVNHLWEFRLASAGEPSQERQSYARTSLSASSEKRLVETVRQGQTEIDDVMVQRLRTGDSQALEYILQSHGVWLINVAERIVGSSDLAQDVVQDVFIWLWNTRSRLEIRGSIAAYLYRAVRNRAMNAQAHERAERTLQKRLAAEAGREEMGSDASRDPEAFAQAFELAVEQALAKLSPKLREVFLLRVERGWSNVEIAETLGIAVASVHQQMYRATKTLAQHLAPWLEAND